MTTQQLTESQVGELKRLAEKATTGQWRRSAIQPYYVISDDDAAYPVVALAEWDASGDLDSVFRNAEANGEFISAANPQTILALLAERQELQAKVEELNQHICECQTELANHDIKCGVDGNVVLGISRLAEKFERLCLEIREAIETLENDGDELGVAHDLREALKSTEGVKS